MSKKINLFTDFKTDFASGLVVFLVALPLCLGIALASGAPLFSGIISGIIGGVVVGYLSVSGPAAGLTAIILTAISDLGAFNILLLAVFIAGLVQLALGFLKAGTISNYFPNNVIEGMLAGIGLIIILKQIPHAIGLDSDFEGDQAFSQMNGENTFSELFSIFNYFQLGSIITTIISLAILILWNKIAFLKKLKVVPGALVAVVVGVLLNEFFTQTRSSLAISKEHLVSLPVPQNFDELKAIFVLPDFSAVTNSKVWVVGFTIAIVASIETLLCIEAADKMDSLKRFSDTNVELKAQGIGNMLSALLGGLPMTSVVVRTSANNAAGAKTKLSAIVHGLFLLVSVFAIPTILNKIPYATLAAILIMVGYKLASPKMLKHFWQKDKIYQFIPFIATFVFVVLTDLLKGVGIGLVINIIFILVGNSKRAYNFRKEEYHDGDIIHIDLAQEVSFLNKASIKATLRDLPNNSKVIINASETAYIAHDVLDLINDFKKIQSKERNIKVKLSGFKNGYNIDDTEPFKNLVSIEHYNVLKRKKVTVTRDKI